MTQQIINVGAVANDGTGESLRSAFQAVNDNFSNVWAQGPVDSQVVISNNVISTNVSNRNLVLRPDGTGVITVASSVVPSIDSVWDLGAANAQYDSVFARYYYGDASNMTGLPQPTDLEAVNTDILPIATQAFNIGSQTQQWGRIYTGGIVAGNGSVITINVGNLHIPGGTNGYVLQTDGAGNLSWTAQTGGGGNGTPGGANTQIQFNDAGAFGGQANFTFNKVTGQMTVPGNIVPASNVTQSLGSASQQWKDLWVANSTIYFNSVPLTLSASNVLSIGGNPIVTVNSGNVSNIGNFVFNGNRLQNNYGGKFDNGGLSTGSTSGLDIPANGNTFPTVLYNIYGNIALQAGSNSDVTAQWNFNNDGTLITQGNIAANSITLSGQAILADGQGAVGELGFDFSGPAINAYINKSVTIRSNDQAHSWRFGNAGNLTLPDGSVIDQGGLYGNGAGVLGNATGDIQVYAQNSGVGIQTNNGNINQTWFFDRNGNLTLPGNTSSINYANGSPYGGGGGAANTGNVTFSDQVIQGTGTQDGGGGLYLAPAVESTANLQYLRVRGGDYVTHIHMDTGNGAFFDQYFGADLKYVKLEANGNVVINSSDFLNGGSNSATWNFGVDSNLTAAGNIISPSNFVGTSLRPNLTDFNWSEAITNIATGATTVITLANNVFGDPWTGQVTITDVTGTTEANATWWYEAVDSNQFILYTDSTLSTLVDSSTWTAYVSGGFAVTLDYGNVEINGQTVTIRSDHGDYNNKIWSFNSNGSTIFPTLTVDLHNGGNQNAQTLQFGDPGQQAVITGPTPPAGQNAQRIIIQGQNGGTGEGGDVYVWAGDADTNGGDIKIYAGDADVSGSGGYINIDAGSGVDGGGQLSFTGGFSQSGGGGPVYISAGQGTAGGVVNINGGGASANAGGYVNIQGGFGQSDGGAVTIAGGGSALGLPGYGNVQITAGVSTWTFDNTGTLTVPQNIYGSGALQLQGLADGNTTINIGSGVGGDIDMVSDLGNINLYTANNQPWIFANTGTMTAPGAINVGNLSIGELPGYITATANTGIILNVSGPDGGFVVDYLKEDGNANTSGGELAFSSETGNATYRISLSDDLGDGFATKIWRFDGTGNITLPGGGSVYSEGFTPSGNPGNTIVLNPHGSGAITNQKLMVYPTAGDGDHLHMTTGNLYQTELFLGSDNFYIKLSNTGNAVINTNDDNGNIAQWNFDFTGNLTLPAGTIIDDVSTDGVTLKVRTAPVTIDIIGADFVAVNLTYTRDFGQATPTWYPPGYNPATDPYIEFSGGEYGIFNPGFGQALYVNTGTFNNPLAQWNINPPLGSVPPTGQYTYSGTGASWTFDTTGNLTTPQGMVISGNVNFLGTDTALLNPADNIPLSLFTSGANGTVTSFWAEDVGNLMTSNIAALYLPLQGTQTVRIVNGNNGGNVAIYDFGNDGVFTTANITATYAYGDTTEANVFVGGTANILGNVSAGNVIISGGIVGSGASPAPYLSGFSSLSAVDVSATGNVSAGNILTNGLISATGNITAGNFIGSGSNVEVVAGAYNWTFANTGDLTLPGNTFAVNYANGAPVTTLPDTVAKASGTWTVASGTNNYSFTVPANGVYQLWVRGNIPNGIITYTATVSITNSNVPVIGVQYAWNYEGAGNPILLTSIPSQIIGTAGTISNALPSVGTSTNTFVFGISNTSGGTVLVDYGYAKIS